MTTRQRSSRTWCHMELPAATKPTNANFVRVIRTKVQSIKIVTNDSIGTCSSELYIFNLLKLPPPPRAAICYIYNSNYAFPFCLNETPASCALNMWGPVGPVSFVILHS